MIETLYPIIHYLAFGIKLGFDHFMQNRENNGNIKFMFHKIYLYDPCAIINKKHKSFCPRNNLNLSKPPNINVDEIKWNITFIIKRNIKVFIKFTYITMEILNI